MDERRPVDRRDDGYVDFQKVHEQLAALTADPVPVFGTETFGVLGLVALFAERITRPRQDDYPVVAVSRDVMERRPELFVNRPNVRSPLQGSAVGMQSDLEDSIATLESHVAILVSVMIERSVG